MKDILAFILAIVVLGLVIIAVSFASLGYEKTFGLWFKDVEREQFTNTKSYVKGIANDLSKFKYELAKTTDPVERQAIINTINERFGDFDAYKFENYKLTQFLIKVQEGDVE